MTRPIMLPVDLKHGLNPPDLLVPAISPKGEVLPLDGEDIKWTGHGPLSHNFQPWAGAPLEIIQWTGNPVPSSVAFRLTNLRASFCLAEGWSRFKWGTVDEIGGPLMIAKAQGHPKAKRAVLAGQVPLGAIAIIQVRPELFDELPGALSLYLTEGDASHTINVGLDMSLTDLADLAAYFVNVVAAHRRWRISLMGGNAEQLAPLDALLAGQRPENDDGILRWYVPYHQDLSETPL